ncbi:MAG TPA: hypothetical protein VE954_43250 [Oligoflexus sp.]|uniref:hypothetical protein n=1 Tax=Oligoflexus sp. TaxID=1971216 RepID=UPI002D609D86|nr:hypothetical protein [Oligoflexus sp.]HYX39962.1 hypothetical protein [Oligoflexus sp.]
MIRALSIILLLVSSEASAQMQCRMEMGDFVCRDGRGLVIKTCRQEMSEYVCRDARGMVIQSCRSDAFGNLNCQ